MRSSILLFALAVSPVPSFGQRQAPPEGAYDRRAYERGEPTLPRRDRDLRLYLVTAAHYAAIDREAALREIRTWSAAEIGRATAALQGQTKNLRSDPTTPEHVDFHLVEAAVLLHAEAGLLYLQQQYLSQAKVHLIAAVDLHQWSRNAAIDVRNWATARQHAFKKEFSNRVVDPRLVIRESIDSRDLHVALAAAALALGFPELAAPLAEKVRAAAPRDAEVQLLAGCAEEGVAMEKAVLDRASDAAPARARAETAFREALVLDPESHEARLRLGKLLLDAGRAAEAEPLLAEVDAKTTDARQRYLARLFLARWAERSGRSERSIEEYRHALETWPGSQAARLGLAHALEKSSGPAASRRIIGPAVDPYRPRGATDPWFLYPIGPPGLAETVLQRVRDRTLRQ